MSAIKGPNIITDGLVLALDAASIRSFRGEPTTNLANTDTSRTLIRHDSGASVTFSDAPEKGDGWKKITINTRGSNFRIARFPYISHPTSTIRTYSVEVDFGTTSGYYVRIDGFAGGANTFSSGRIFTTFTTTTNNGSLALFINHNTISTSGLNDVIYYRYYQVENMPYPTAFTEGIRGTTVATGGGIADLTGTGNHGELVNGPSFNSDNFGSLAFDGINQRINSTSFSVPFLTVSTWVYRTSTASNQGICRKQNGWAISQFNGTLQLAPGTSWAFYDTGYTIPLNTWVNITYRYSGSGSDTQSIFINGVLTWINANGTGSLPTNSNPVRIGFDDNNWWWGGRITQTLIYNRALSDIEVQRNYNATRRRFGL